MLFRSLLILTLFAINSVSAQAIASAQASKVAGANPESGLTARIDVNLDGVTLDNALRTIARQANLVATFGYRVNESSRRVTLREPGITADAAFRKALKGTGVTFALTRTGHVLFTRADQGNARNAQGVIAGKVTDAKTGRGVSGANISVGNDTRGVTTGEDGSYRLAGISAGTHAVTVRLLGYAKQTRSVTIGEGAAVSADFKLEPSANVLDQVVVTGTVVASELKSVPNAITVVTAKQIEERGITRIDQLFRGDIPGLFAINRGATTFVDQVVMFSRGATGLPATSGSLAVTNPIKTYIDGVEMADSKYLSQIDPKTIERIEILAGPQAGTIYGSNAINGVMQIFTKRGTTSRPQLSLTLLSGWVENNFSSARTPQHDYNAQISGVEGRLSYNAGGSWNYMGAWTPNEQLSHTGGFGGARLDLSTPAGRVTADVTLRRTITHSLARGSEGQTAAEYLETGWWLSTGSFGATQPTTRALASQTLGMTLSYVPTSWWSHEFGIGQDASDAETRQTERSYKTPGFTLIPGCCAISNGDTTLFLSRNHTERRSLRYVTTARLPVTSFAQATVTAGADGWQNLTSSISARPQTLTGPLTNVFGVTRVPGHNTGGFLQTQLGIRDRLFLTYGLRAEWHPDFGDDAQPNIAPRYGVAYTQEIGTLTAKVRGSYGRSTRPPARSLKVGKTIVEEYGSDWSFYEPSFTPYYGSIFNVWLPNPDLAPEYQQGGEAGLELYLGTRGSLIITRYNQTVDGLITEVKADSVRTLVPCPLDTCSAQSFDDDGFGYYHQYQYPNVASIRNQGWELQGSMNVGPITTRGTYSWTKSRSLGMTSKFRAQFPASFYPQYQPGATFQFLPEHTWAFGMTYARAASSVGLSVTGTGEMRNSSSELVHRSLDANIRLPQNRLRMLGSGSGYVSFHTGYAMADLTASHRFVPRVEGVLQVQNLTDYYKNDFDGFGATMGRQLKVGVRVR